MIRRIQTTPAEREQILNDIVERLADGEADTRTLAEWTGSDRTQTLRRCEALQSAGRIRLVSRVELPGGAFGFVWGAP